MVLMEGLTASGKKKTLTLDDSGNLISQGSPEQIASGGLQEGTDITGASMPSGGTSGRGWLSAIWKLISDRLPAPVNSKIPVDSGSLQEGTDITGASMPSGGTSGRGWLSAIWKLISDRLPAPVNSKIPVDSGSLQEGTDITGASMPSGGTSGRGWLSAIWKLISDRLPAPVNSKIPVDSGSLQEGTDITGASMPSGGTSGRGWLSAIWKLISDRFPTLGAKTASGSIPVTLSTDGAFSTNFGLISDGVASSESAQSSFISLFRYLLIATLVKGQQAMGSSISVTIASNQSSVVGLASQADIQEVRDRLTPSTGISFTQVLGTASSGFLKGSAGIIYTMSVINTGSAKKYLLLFNKNTTPNSSDTIARVFPVPSGDSTQDGFLFIGQQEIGGGGISLSAGLAWMISTSPTTPTAATASETILGFRWA